MTQAAARRIAPLLALLGLGAVAVLLRLWEVQAWPATVMLGVPRHGWP